MRYLIAKYLKGEAAPKYLQAEPDGKLPGWLDHKETAALFGAEKALELALELNATVIPVESK